MVNFFVFEKHETRLDWVVRLEKTSSERFTFQKYDSLIPDAKENIQLIVKVSVEYLNSL